MIKKTSIFLVDDHQIVLDGLTAILEQLEEFELVGTAANGKSALQQIEILRPDMILMDIEMPIMNGILLAKETLERFPEIKIIMLSLHFEQPIIRKMMEQNVAGYLLKNSDKYELIHAIRMVAQGKKYFSSEITTALMDKSFRAEAQKNHPESAQLALLSERELEILKAIADGFSNQEIADQLFLSIRTVETHRFNIMKKLNLKKLAQLIRFAVRNGLVED